MCQDAVVFFVVRLIWPGASSAPGDALLYACRCSAPVSSCSKRPPTARRWLAGSLPRQARNVLLKSSAMDPRGFTAKVGGCAALWKLPGGVGIVGGGVAGGAVASSASPGVLGLGKHQAGAGAQLCVLRGASGCAAAPSLGCHVCILHDTLSTRPALL